MQHARPLTDFLKLAYRRLNLDEAMLEMDVRNAYKGVVGDMIFKLTLSLKFERGVLKVKLASPALRNELSYRIEDLARRINDTLGAVVVTKIVFF